MKAPRDPATVAAELAQREPIFHRAVDGTTRANWEVMTAPDSGRWALGSV